MSQPRKMMINPNRPPIMDRNTFSQSLTNSKRKISQTQGEAFDALNDRINLEMQKIFESCMEIFDKLELSEHENTQFQVKIKELETRLQKYEPREKPTQLQKTETETPPKK